ncbi:hypothetical protein TNIN_375661 [Trichonephila inaurata madagascariensis]|uniref:non-specific serine/threonine protein kinase n=1 Tax=Trichonephila inaurata madagascariensis TaxID=2747483 RepID=A0A8X6IMK0_9ARAC|nr:hypothetical protein TNIN_375661 [Trichonephila inaurata madagascariensis]
MDSVLTISPSENHHLSPSDASLNQCSGPQTTPKLPKRERLASFSRLVTSSNFLDLLPSKSTNGYRRRINVKGRDFAIETLPSIRISPSSPPGQKLPQRKIDASFLQAVGKGCLDSPQLPFSPRLLNNQSPRYMSPNYKYPTPTKSPLYKSDCKSGFLGRGSFGNVTLCIYKNSKFALKVSRRKSCFVGEENFLEIRHPHLVSILYTSQVSDKVFIFMEFAGHCNLQQVLDTKSELDFPRRISFCIQILSGLRHCHQQRIVHADVKPANVIVSPHGICKLGDFGHSFNLDSMTTEPNTHPVEDIVGTAAYAAPEVLRGSRPTPFSDIYSFGVLLWQVQSRELPFAGEHPHVAHYGARPSFVDIKSPLMLQFSEVAKLCWCEDPSTRISASQAHKMLQDLAQQSKAITK